MSQFKFVLTALGIFLLTGKASAESIDPYTVLYLNFNEVNASNNFIDSSAHHHSVYSEGSVQIDNSVVALGSGSARFSGGRIVMPQSVDWDFGGHDFTIDFWVRFPRALGALASDNQGLVGQYASQADRWSIMYDSLRLGFFWVSSGDILVDSWSPWTVAGNTWYHLAVERHNEELLKFINGHLVEATEGSPIDIGNSVLGFVLGSFYLGESQGWGPNLEGWLDEVRVSKGIARWTQDFDPYNSPEPSAIPEPGTLPVFALGLLIISMARSKRP